MFGQLWTHDTIRKYVIFFGTLFIDVYLARGEPDPADPEQVMKVPLNYGPKEKYLARLEGNPDLDRDIAIQLPRMSFEITGFNYDADRKLPSTNKICVTDPNNPGKKLYQYAPVPWNIQFNLYIMVKNQSDGTRIIEQILPFFRPEFTGAVNVNTEMLQSYDVPVILNSMDIQDTYEGSFEIRRAIIWTLSFTMKGWLFGPVRRGNIIKQSEVYMRVPADGITIEQGIGQSNSALTVTVTPGLTANGEPTSDPNLTIDKDLIESTDNYGFITDFEENY